MKKGLHPTWYNDAKVTCACGATFTTGSTQENIKLDICSNCHPLYTGTQKFVDTLGQVDRYISKTKKVEEKKIQREQILHQRAQKSTAAKTDKPSLKDLLMQARKDLHS